MPRPGMRASAEPTLNDDLYPASIVAVKPDTGEYVWHYQETPGDAWDYDAVSPMMTADLTIGGHKKHVILQPSKNGFFYVLEATTGKLHQRRSVHRSELGHGSGLEDGPPEGRAGGAL